VHSRCTLLLLYENLRQKTPKLTPCRKCQGVWLHRNVVIWWKHAQNIGLLPPTKAWCTGWATRWLDRKRVLSMYRYIGGATTRKVGMVNSSPFCNLSSFHPPYSATCPFSSFSSFLMGVTKHRKLLIRKARRCVLYITFYSYRSTVGLVMKWYAQKAKSTKNISIINGVSCENESFLYRSFVLRNVFVNARPLLRHIVLCSQHSWLQLLAQARPDLSCQKIGVSMLSCSVGCLMINSTVSIQFQDTEAIA